MVKVLEKFKDKIAKFTDEYDKNEFIEKQTEILEFWAKEDFIEEMIMKPTLKEVQAIINEEKESGIMNKEQLDEMKKKGETASIKKQLEWRIHRRMLDLLKEKK